MAQKLMSTGPLYNYTKGKEFVLDETEYVGEYHYKGNDAYTGPKPSIDSKKLEMYHPSIDVLRYIKIHPKQKVFLTYVEPTRGLIFPTENNYVTGIMQRFFVQHRLQKENIVELDFEQASVYSKEKGIDPVLYQLVSLKWAVTRNPKKIDLIKLENFKFVLEANKQMPGLSDVIYNYIEFSEIII